MNTLTFEYRNPPHRILFGRGALNKVAAELASISARKPMLVCSERAAQSPGGRALIAALDLPAEAVFAGVGTHAPVNAVLEAWRRARALEPDCFIALGGGSAADSTKGLALAYAENGRVLDFVLERTPDGRLVSRQSTGAKLPVVAIPTTLSGAEVSPQFALTDETSKKLIFRDNAVAPSILVYDPDLVRARLDTLAPSAMNSIAHTLEALYSKARNPISEMYALDGLRLLYQGLSAAIADPEDSDAYVSLTLGSYYAAAAIVNARTALHHATCHKLAPVIGVSHGTANAIILPHALRFNLPAAKAELARAARVMSDGTGDARPEAAIEKIESLCERTGLPRRLRDVGVKQEMFPALAANIFSEPGLAFNPREIQSVEEIEGVLHAAW